MHGRHPSILTCSGITARDFSKTTEPSQEDHFLVCMRLNVQYLTEWSGNLSSRCRHVKRQISTLRRCAREEYHHPGLFERGHMVRLHECGWSGRSAAIHLSRAVTAMNSTNTDRCIRQSAVEERGTTSGEILQSVGACTIFAGLNKNHSSPFEWSCPAGTARTAFDPLESCGMAMVACASGHYPPPVRFNECLFASLLVLSREEALPNIERRDVRDTVPRKLLSLPRNMARSTLPLIPDVHLSTHPLQLTASATTGKKTYQLIYRILEFYIQYDTQLDRQTSGEPVFSVINNCVNTTQQIPQQERGRGGVVVRLLDSLRCRSRTFACWNRAGRCRWSAGFLDDLPFPPPFHSGTAPYSPRFTHVGSQDFYVNSNQNLSTHSLHSRNNYAFLTRANKDSPHLNLETGGSIWLVRITTRDTPKAAGSSLPDIPTWKFLPTSSAAVVEKAPTLASRRPISIPCFTLANWPPSSFSGGGRCRVAYCAYLDHIQHGARPVTPQSLSHSHLKHAGCLHAANSRRSPSSRQELAAWGSGPVLTAVSKQHAPLFILADRFLIAAQRQSP
ncbi:hypothetical protein PR048_015767 [Dryococelus australis]|uniref:Uncharacterized protein n=1 Tax=Dryococelus australis TaxID=614101 RepID=A0ABQ9HI32_9NEOP|nr:hypothetical protein PR048_015767 [Dryococelus australis]